MGSRYTQIIGLSDRAEKYIEKNKQTKMIKCSCPYCQKPHIEISICENHKDASNEGMFDDGPMLHKYLLKSQVPGAKHPA